MGTGTSLLLCVIALRAFLNYHFLLIFSSSRVLVKRMFRPMEEEFGPAPSKQMKEEGMKRGTPPAGAWLWAPRSLY